MSDSCSDFLAAVEDAARKLAEDARHYSSPPFRYGGEAEALRHAGTKGAAPRDDPDAVARFIRLAAAVMDYHDTPPHWPERQERRRAMDALIRQVQAEPGPDDA